jgi:F420H(2)-dependent quinone reductase
MDIVSWAERTFGRRLLKVHEAVLKRTNGRVGHRIPLPGVPPSLLLHTLGAKTGAARTNALSYFADGGHYYVVASNGGDRRAPGWYHNLKARPEAEINVGTRRLAVATTVLLDDDADYARLWAKVNRQNSNRYNDYQRRTTRTIPLVRLTPTP